MYGISYRALRTTGPHFTFALVRASHEATSELAFAINNPRKSHCEVGHGAKYVQNRLTEESQD